MKRPIKVFLLVISTIILSACSNLRGASDSSTSLASFLGFTELPDWYVTSNYAYPDSKWIKNDFGHRIHYRDVGAGPTVVLIHGEISSIHTWEPWIETLSQDFRVISIDLPGSGLTGAPHCIENLEDTCSENLTLDYINHTFQYFVEDLRLSSFILIGSSFGGYLASTYAIENPHKVDKLVLISPMGFQQETPSILKYVTTPGTDFINSLVQPSAVITTIVDDFYGVRDNLTPDNLKRYVDLAQSQGTHETNVRYLKFVRHLMDRGMSVKISDINKPTLILWGERDEWGVPDHADLWKEEIEGALAVKYPYLGHVPMEEDPEASSADVVAFLNDDPIPSLETLEGGGSSFTIDEALDSFDTESLFSLPSAEESEEEMLEEQ